MNGKVVESSKKLRYNKTEIPNSSFMHHIICGKRRSVRHKRGGGKQVKSETNLARNILQTGAKSAYDAACKRLLANKIILA